VTQNSNYVRVFIDQYERVAAITYLGSKPIEADNYQTLIGLHQAYLNRIVDRFDENLITDLIRYFTVCMNLVSDISVSCESHGHKRCITIALLNFDRRCYRW